MPDHSEETKPPIRIPLPYVPTYGKRGKARLISAAAGPVVIGLLLSFSGIYRNVRDGQSYWGSATLLILIILYGAGVWIFARYFAAQLRLRFDSHGLSKHSSSGWKSLIAWSEIERVGYTDAGRGDAEWVILGSGRKVAITPAFYDDGDTVRRILVEQISPYATIPEYLLNAPPKSDG